MLLWHNVLSKLKMAWSVSSWTWLLLSGHIILCATRRTVNIYWLLVSQRTSVSTRSNTRSSARSLRSLVTSHLMALRLVSAADVLAVDFVICAGDTRRVLVVASRQCTGQESNLQFLDPKSDAVTTRPSRHSCSCSHQVQVSYSVTTATTTTTMT